MNKSENRRGLGYAPTASAASPCSTVAAATGRRRDRVLVWSTFAVVLAVAVSVQRGSSYVYDGRVMLGVAQNLVDHGSLHTTYDPLRQNSPYSSYGIGMTLAFIPAVLIAKVLGISALSVAPLTNAVIVAATGAALLKLALAARMSRATGLVAALVYGLLTMAIGYVGDGFSEPGVALAGVVALLGLVRWRDGERSGPRLAGTGMALGALFRTDALILIALPLLLLLPAFVPRPWSRSQVSNVLRCLIPLLVVVAWIAWYDQHRFGNPLTTGYPGQTFSTPLLLGVRAFLIQGGRGFFWFNPALLLALPGLAFLGRRNRPLMAALVVLPVLRLLFYARWWGWYGGVCWGPRYLEPACALLALPAAVAIVAAFRSASRTAVFARVGVVALCVAGAAVSLLAVLVPYWSYFQLHDDQPLVLPIPVGAADRPYWNLPGKHDLLFSLVNGQLGGNVRLLFGKLTNPKYPDHTLPSPAIAAISLTVAVVALGLASLAAVRALDSRAADPGHRDLASTG